MSFVHLQIVRARWSWVPHHIALSLRWLPENSIEEQCSRILPCQLCPGRHAVEPLSKLPFNADANLGTMRDSPTSIGLVWQIHSPSSKARIPHRILVRPAVEFSGEEGLLGGWEPLSEGPLSGDIVAVEAVDVVAGGKGFQTALLLLQLRLPLSVAPDAWHDRVLMGFETWVILENSEHVGDGRCKSCLLVGSNVHLRKDSGV
mmetsp:Transcript_66966/g.160399  ORF Transcript_66966/g.160399 Transcript_66966/m.160399 type:complete len:203 (-) Transcript_66966:54-662(-)